MPYRITAAALRTAAVLVSVAGMLTPIPLRALDTGKTSRGEAFTIGGNVEDERAVMRQERKKFDLWVQTAANAGADLPGADVRITTTTGITVLAVHVKAPWLFVNLAAGEYRVAVTAQGRTEERRTLIHDGDHTEMVFYFDTPAPPALPGPGMY